MLKARQTCDVLSTKMNALRSYILSPGQLVFSRSRVRESGTSQSHGAVIEPSRVICLNKVQSTEILKEKHTKHQEGLRA